MAHAPLKRERFADLMRPGKRSRRRRKRFREQERRAEFRAWVKATGWKSPGYLPLPKGGES